MFEKSQLKTTSTASNPQKLQQNYNILQGFLSVAEAAELLNKPAITVSRWCKAGELTAIPQPYGSSITYRIPLQAVELKKAELERKANKQPKQTSIVLKHSAQVDGWIAAMEGGTLTGKKYSPITVEDYQGHVEEFIRKYQTVSVTSLQQALGECRGLYSRRFKLYKAVICFAKHLHQQGQLSTEFFTEVKPLFPKRDKAPKRITVDEDGLLKLLEACQKPIDTALLIMLATTGLRASELCKLELSDVQLEKQVFMAKHRKAGKSTRLGLNKEAIAALRTYRDSLPTWIDSPYLFVDDSGKPLTRMTVYNRLRPLSKRTGIPVHPHALRRAFVTINANKGRPLQMLQIACGHSSIKTTMDYCRTTEEEVIEAMKRWD